MHHIYGQAARGNRCAQLRRAAYEPPISHPPQYLDTVAFFSANALCCDASLREPFSTIPFSHGASRQASCRRSETAAFVIVAGFCNATHGFRWQLRSFSSSHNLASSYDLGASVGLHLGEGFDSAVSLPSKVAPRNSCVL